MIEIIIVQCNKETNCLNCGEQGIIKDLKKIILDCTTYNKERQQLIELQKPHSENKDNVIERFLLSKVIKCGRRENVN